ncbi:MAG: cytochrome b [Gammaproteobacteria bacterium]
MSLMNTKDSFGSITRTLHWLLAVLVIGMLTVGLLLSDIGSPLVYKIHKFTGLVVLTVAIISILWNMCNVRPGYDAMPRIQEILAKSVHHLLLLCVVIMPLSGWVFSTAAGKPPMLGSLALPMPFIPHDPELVHWGVTVHGFIANILIGLIVIHTLAALTHHFILKDNILKRMVKG